MKRIALAIALFLMLNRVTAQTTDSLWQARIKDSLLTLFSQIRNGALNPDLANPADTAILSDYHDEKGIPTIINCYPLSPKQYMVSTSFTDSASLQAIITLVAEINEEKIRFSLPLNWLTRNWKEQKVGNITYYYEGAFNKQHARAFDRNNTTIARRLNQTPESFRFYLTDNYQQALQLLGYTYDRASSGRTRGGFLTSTHTIFAIQHNEDFSHDIFHWYSAKLRTAGVKRNAATEEGLAYDWGNAYYTDSSGNMITQSQLLAALHRYIDTHPGSTPLTLFTTNPKIFNDLAPEISVRSTISGLLCEEVWKQKGLEGIKILLNSGAGEENYMRAIDQLIHVNKDNFDEKVRGLLH